MSPLHHYETASTLARHRAEQLRSAARPRRTGRPRVPRRPTPGWPQ